MSHHIVAIWIIVCSICIGLSALFLPLYGPIDLAHQWTKTAITPQSMRTLMTMLSITAGSIIGQWIMHGWLAWGPLRRGESWARHANLAGALSYGLVSAATCVGVGLPWYIAALNFAPLMLLCPALLLLKNTAPNPNTTKDPARKWTTWTTIGGIGSGIIIALDPWLGTFAPWFAFLDANTHQMAWLFFGPIGGCVVAQFVMMAMTAHHSPEHQKPWRILTLALMGWFLVDSTWGLIHGALFNVLLINIPTLLTQLPFYAWWRHRAIRQGTT